MMVLIFGCLMVLIVNGSGCLVVLIVYNCLFFYRISQIGFELLF